MLVLLIGGIGCGGPWDPTAAPPPILVITAMPLELAPLFDLLRPAGGKIVQQHTDEKITAQRRNCGEENCQLPPGKRLESEIFQDVGAQFANVIFWIHGNRGKNDPAAGSGV